MPNNTIRDDVIERFPGLAKRAELGQRMPMIKLFCIECMGGSYADAKSCATKECFLWPGAFRRGKDETVT